MDNLFGKWSYFSAIRFVVLNVFINYLVIKVGAS